MTFVVMQRCVSGSRVSALLGLRVLVFFGGILFGLRFLRVEGLGFRVFGLKV